MTTLPQACAEIQQRCDAAPEGPWLVDPNGEIWHEIVDRCGEPAQELLAHSAGATATFIAHAREDIPYLLRALAALEAENQRMLTDALILADYADKEGEHSSLSRVGGCAVCQALVRIRTRTPAAPTGQGEAG